MNFAFIASIVGFIKKPNWRAFSGVAVSSNGFDAIDDDPQLICSTLGWLPGWYMLELNVEYSVPGQIGMIYLNTGYGFHESDVYKAPLQSGRLLKRLVYLPASLRSLRFDPSCEPCSFNIHKSAFVWLTPWKARRIALNYLTTADTPYQGLPLPALVAKLQSDAKNGQTWWEKAWLEYDHWVSNVVMPKNYSVWQKSHKLDNNSKANVLLNDMKTWKFLPCISIILPVYNTPPDLLEEAIVSVLDQSYSNWQLCIADDASYCNETHDILRKYSNLDKRINVVWRSDNGHISAASQSALNISIGDYVALLDHDDLLDSNALLFVVEAINLNPEVKLLYTDEDKINIKGEFFDPHFKPDWNPDLLLSQNYISHFSVFESARLKDLGGFRQGFEGSQDHDLLLRFSRTLDMKSVVHIPRVLYHWRALEGSTALDASAKNYTQDSGLKALEDYISVQGYKAKVVSGAASNTYRVLWEIPEPKPLVSLIIPTRDGLDILKPCVDALLKKTLYQNFELIIIDNQSTCLLTLSYLSKLADSDARVRVLRWDYPFNYSAINNFAAKQAKGSILGLINNDIEPINKEWLDEMVSQVCRPDIGCVGAKLYYPDGRIQHGGVILGLGGVAGHSHKYFSRNDDGYFCRLQLVQNLSAVTAACLLVRKSVFDQVGGLNEQYLKVAFNDVDFCLRVREAGYRNLWTPYAELYHHESISRGADDTPEKQKRFRSELAYMRDTWGEILDHDPAYNPNLTLDAENFGLR